MSPCILDQGHYTGHKELGTAIIRYASTYILFIACIDWYPQSTILPSRASSIRVCKDGNYATGAVASWLNYRMVTIQCI